MSEYHIRAVFAILEPV